MLMNNTARRVYAEDPIRCKRENFRLEIRNRHIEQIKKQTRELYRQKIRNVDYSIVKGIDLIPLFKSLKKFGIDEENVHQLFVYASNECSDHLFELFDDTLVDVLTKNLIIEEPNQDGIKWNRKVFRILTNFTIYSQTMNWDYLAQMKRIADTLFQEGFQKTINYSDETEKNIVISLSVWMEKGNLCRDILKIQGNFVNDILERFYDRTPSLAQMVAQEPKGIPSLVRYHCELIHNVYSCLQYSELQEDVQLSILRQIHKVLKALPTTTPLCEEQGKLVIILLDSVRKLFGNSLDEAPWLLISYKKYFIKISKWFHNFLNRQHNSSKFQSIVMEYLMLMRVVYGPNLYEDIENDVIDFYKHLFTDYVGMFAYQFLRQSEPLFHNYTLKMLQTIFMETEMCVFIIDSYSPLVSLIFMGVQTYSYSLKKQALLCLMSIIECGIGSNNNQQTSCEIMQLFSSCQIASILANNLWEYTDKELNMQLMNGVKVLLKADRNQYQASTCFWHKFVTDGRPKLHRIIEQSSEAQLRQEAENLLIMARQSGFEDDNGPLQQF